MNQTVKSGTLLALIIISMILLALIIQKIAAMIMLIFIAVIITSGISPLVESIQHFFSRRWRMPRALSTIIVLSASLLLLFGIFASIVVTAISESTRFANETWPIMQPRILQWGVNLSRHYSFIPSPAEMLAHLQAQSGDIAGYFWSTTRAIFGFLGGIFSAFSIIIMTFFFTVFKHDITATLIQLIPLQYHEKVQYVGHHAGAKMGGWLRGQLLLAIIITLITSAGMWLFQIPYPMMIGIIGGLGELIPMVGPYVAFFPALAIALVTGQPTWVIILMTIFFMALAQVENYLLAPKIMERHVGLHPITTILALFIGGSLLGIVGALLAVPVAAAGRVIMIEAIFPAIRNKGIVSTTEISPPVADSTQI